MNKTKTPGHLAESARGTVPDESDMHRQPMVNFSRRLADQYPEPGEDVVRALWWICGIVAVVVGTLKLPGVL